VVVNEGVLLLPVIITVPSLCVAATLLPSTKQASDRVLKENTKTGHIFAALVEMPLLAPSTIKLQTLSVSLSSPKNFFAPKCSLTSNFCALADPLEFRMLS
jgi:hypothetical protein